MWRGKGQMGLAAAAFLLVFLSTSHCFYLPGVAPKAFKDGQPVNMKVQTLVSTETPLQVTFVAFQLFSEFEGESLL